MDVQGLGGDRLPAAETSALRPASVHRRAVRYGGDKFDLLWATCTENDDVMGPTCQRRAWVPLHGKALEALYARAHQDLDDGGSRSGTSRIRRDDGCGKARRGAAAVSVELQ